MAGGDLTVYVKQFEEIIRCLSTTEEQKVKLFKNGSDAKYFALVAAAPLVPTRRSNALDARRMGI